MKNEMRVGTQLFLGKTVAGLLWIGAGVSGCFRSIAGSIVSIGFLLLAAIIATILLKARAERSDEMARQNLMEAKSKTRDIMHMLYCVLAVAAASALGLLKDIDVSWPRMVSQLFFVLMGVQDLLTGIIFRKLEAA